MISRSSGVLLHITSLPGSFGCGTMGEWAYRFVDFLEKSGQRYWQILPLNPADEYGSPYASASSFAGNFLLIDPGFLFENGLLTRDECDGAAIHSPDQSAPFPLLLQQREALLKRAYSRINASWAEKLDSFVQNSPWLSDYALFTALCSHFASPLSQWPDAAAKKRDPQTLSMYAEILRDDIRYLCFCQLLFYRQWSSLKSYANRKNIHIIGDIPFYVSPSSADIWSNPELFAVDENLSPTRVSGVPPDAFSRTGQVWGNPLYLWTQHEKDNFSWWRERIAHCGELYDVLRIDHFRAVHSYWDIPAGDENAFGGSWKPGPGKAFLDAVFSVSNRPELIAEDLGDLSVEARIFCQNSGLPGMRVLVQAFDGGTDSIFLPHNCNRNAILYTSTHDTPTFIQWFSELCSAGQKKFAEDYLRLRLDEGLNWGAVKAAQSSHANLCICAMQDVLGLGRDARMNTPGTIGSNWNWRIREEALGDEVSSILRQISYLYGRV